MKKGVKVFLIIILLLVITVYISKSVSPKEIDDVSPGIFCENEYMEKADVLWIIPKFNSTSISENKTWCNDILNLNKTLGMHGFEHYYHEFSDNKSINHLNESITIWQDCFDETPLLFKAPNLALSYENEKLIESYNITVVSYFNQLTHTVYHCSDSGTLPNWFHDLF